MMLFHVAVSDKESNQTTRLWSPRWRRCPRPCFLQADWLGENREQRSSATIQTQNCEI